MLFVAAAVDRGGRFAAGVMAGVDKGAYGSIEALLVEGPLRYQGPGTYLLEEVKKPAGEAFSRTGLRCRGSVRRNKPGAAH